MKYEPMLASTLRTDIKDTKGYYEIKLDGGRCIVENLEITTLRSRKNNVFNNKFPKILADLEKQRKAIFDAEIVVFNKEGLTSFPLFLRRNTDNPIQQERLAKILPATLMIFDILELDGEDLTDKPLSERKHILKDILVETDNIKYVDHYTTYEHLIKMEKIEGIMIKDPDAIYQVGKRCRNWQKMKFNKEEIFKVVSYEEHDRGILMYTEEGHRINCNGHMAEKGKELMRTGPFNIEVSYLEKTKNGDLRFPAFKRFTGAGHGDSI